MAIGTKVEIQGESEYRKALKDITSSLKLVSSEMKLTTTQFESGDKSIRQTKTAYESMNKAVQDQKAKITELRTALTQAEKEYGSNNEKVKMFKTQLNNAENQLKQMESATDKSTKELKEMKQGFNDAGQGAIKFGDLLKANLTSEAIIGGVKALGGAIVDVAKKMTSFISDGVQNASNLQEVQNVVDTTFGDSATVIDEWAKKASTSYGMSELSAKKYNGTMGAMLKSMKLSDDEIIKMSTDMVGLAGDFASFYNLDSEEAFNKIRAGISGETEPLKQLGINMSVANLEAFALSQGIDKSYKSMTQAEQATLRYNYLMSATKDAQGDFAKTSDSFANQQRIAQLQLENLATSIGSFLLPSINEAMTVFNDMLSGEITFEEGITRMTEMVMGLATKIIEKLPELLNAGMSMLQTIVSGIQTALPQIIPIVLQIINTLLTTIIQMLPQILQMGITILVELVKGIAQSLPTLIPAMIDAVLLMVETLIDNIDMIIDAGIELIMGLAEGLIEALPDLIEKIPVIIDKLIMAITNNLPKIIEMGIKLTIELAKGLIKAIPDLLKAIPQIITSIVKGFANYYSKIFDIGKDLVKGIWNGISDATSWILNKIKGFGNSVLKGIKKIFGINSPSRLFKDEVGTYLAQGIGEGFSSEMKNVSDQMASSIPTNFDTSVNVKSSTSSKGSSYDNMVGAFKQALTDVKVVMNDREMGTFVTDTMTKVVYS